MHRILIKRAEGAQKIRGLIGKKEAEAILIRTRFGIHTFGLRFPIDVLILDRHGLVRVVRENFRPNGIFLWNPKYEKVVELSEGFIKRHRVKLGEKVRFSFR
jgi:uncharacterized membrane protein (UPF0127 family)